MSLLDRTDLTIAIMDIEASGFGPASYPIEIGIALIRGTAARIQLWETLIRPTPEWANSGLWSKASAEVHGIQKEELDAGREAAEVAEKLNLLLKSTLVVTDAPSYDQTWLDRLYAAAGCEQRFILNDFDLLTGHLSRDDYRQVVHLLDRKPIPHRAGADALRLATALLEARMGSSPYFNSIK